MPIAIFTVLIPLSVFSMSFKESVLFVEGKTYSKNQRWTRVSTNSENQIELLLKILSSSKSGKLLIDKANKLIQKRNSKKSLYDFVKKGRYPLQIQLSYGILRWRGQTTSPMNPNPKYF